MNTDIQTTLGERHIPVEIYPYNFSEYLTANHINITENSLFSTEAKAGVLRKFNEYLYFGGFPEGAELSVKRDYLTSVYQKIYIGDIANKSVEVIPAWKWLLD
ncbi:MAG: hypothetical protein Q7J05_05045 [Paludibacter sp.]|nr:hypothetical protein [Paludibacter sp.]